MSGLQDGSGAHLLLDTRYWRPRLERLGDVPRRLLQIERPELAREGTEVIELRMQAHDGEALVALLARSTFHAKGSAVHVRRCTALETSAIDWKSVEGGATDLVFRYPGPPGGRHLEDRALDVVRIIDAACSLESVDCSCVEFPAGSRPLPDEFLLARLFRQKGWI